MERADSRVPDETLAQTQAVIGTLSVLVDSSTVSYFEYECWEELGQRWSQSIRFVPLLGTFVWVLVNEGAGVARAGFARSVELAHGAIDRAVETYPITEDGVTAEAS